MQSSDSVPHLDFTSALPPHYLKAWKAFIHSLKQSNITTYERDRLVLAILPIFHYPLIKAPMRILSQAEVQKLAGLEDHFDKVHAHKNLLTEMTVRNYCGNSFHPEYIQAAVGHPERLRSWLATPVDQPPTPAWQGVIHPKQVRQQYHALREQVQALAHTRQIKNLDSQQVGLDPMPDFPTHELEGKLAPVTPTIFPTQLQTTRRKFTDDELGIKNDNPPAQLSDKAIQPLQQQHMQQLLQGMRFFGAGISKPEHILPFFFGTETENVVTRHCAGAEDWLAAQLQASINSPATMAQFLLYVYQLMHKELQSVHIVHLMDWEDHACAIAIGDAPARWTVYCAQFPKLQSFHLDTAPWNYREITPLPWQPTPHLWAPDGNYDLFQSSNPNCMWFAFPYGPDGQYVVGNKFCGTFMYTRCIPCLFSWLVLQVSCRTHTTNNSHPELKGVLFVENEGQIAVATNHGWRASENVGCQTCLVTATIDQRTFHYTEHSSSFARIDPVGQVSRELYDKWGNSVSLPSTAFFLCHLSS